MFTTCLAPTKVILMEPCFAHLSKEFASVGSLQGLHCCLTPVKRLAWTEFAAPQDACWRETHVYNLLGTDKGDFGGAVLCALI